MEQIFYELRDWLGSLGAWAYLFAPLVMAAVAVLPIPAEAFAMANGALFGPVAGVTLTWVGSMLGAIASFELARRLGRPAATRLLRPSAIDRADEFVLSAGWGGLLLARLMPLIAFTALNWGAGLTPISRWRFVWTTGLGIIPGAILFTASGWGIAAVIQQLHWIGIGLAVLLIGWIWWRRSRGSRAAVAAGADTAGAAGADTPGAAGADAPGDAARDPVAGSG